MRHNRQITITIKVWIPAAIFILVPLVCLNISTSVLLHTLQQENMERLTVSMETASKTLDSVIKETDTTVQLITSNSAVKTLALIPPNKDLIDYSQIAKAKEGISLYQQCQQPSRCHCHHRHSPGKAGYHFRVCDPGQRRQRDVGCRRSYFI